YDYLLRLNVPMTSTAGEPWPGAGSCTLPAEEGCPATGCPVARVIDVPHYFDPNWRIRDWWGPVKRWGPVVVGVGGNVLYVPAKVGFASVGAVATGLTYLGSLGSTDAAGSVWDAAAGGDYVVMPEMVEQRRAPSFVGHASR